MEEIIEEWERQDQADEQQSLEGNAVVQDDMAQEPCESRPPSILDHVMEEDEQRPSTGRPTWAQDVGVDPDRDVEPAVDEGSVDGDLGEEVEENQEQEPCPLQDMPPLDRGSYYNSPEDNCLYHQCNNESEWRHSRRAQEAGYCTPEEYDRAAEEARNARHAEQFRAANETPVNQDPCPDGPRGRLLETSIGVSEIVDEMALGPDFSRGRHPNADRCPVADPCPGELRTGGAEAALDAAGDALTPGWSLPTSHQGAPGVAGGVGLAHDGVRAGLNLDHALQCQTDDGARIRREQEAIQDFACRTGRDPIAVANDYRAAIEMMNTRGQCQLDQTNED